jgi:redox-sensitive bicupin YhaK (pirin superfamily)
MQLDWLNANYSFSFGDYYDRRFMGFGHLRVLNDDYIGPKGGFPTHPHKDMEIISYVVEGRFVHKDSTGTEGDVYPGKVQVLTAGTGIRHSGFNPSSTDTAHSYQIWITPSRKSLSPLYSEITYDPEEARNTLKLLVSPDRSQGSLPINQQVWMYESKLDAGQELSLPGDARTVSWLQVVSGRLVTGGLEASQGDGVAYEGASEPVRAIDSSHFIYFVMIV